MKKKLKITSDHITLIKNMRFEQINDRYNGIDTYAPFGSSYPLWDIAFMLGKQDKVIPETMEDPMGPKFEPETQEYLETLGGEMYENMVYYHSIALQFCDVGFKPGRYSCVLPDTLWTYDGPLKEEKHD